MGLQKDFAAVNMPKTNQNLSSQKFVLQKQNPRIQCFYLTIKIPKHGPKSFFVLAHQKNKKTHVSTSQLAILPQKQTTFRQCSEFNIAFAGLRHRFLWAPPFPRLASSAVTGPRASHWISLSTARQVVPGDAMAQQLRDKAIVTGGPHLKGEDGITDAINVPKKCTDTKKYNYIYIYIHIFLSFFI